MICTVQKTTWTIFLLLYHVAKILGQDNRCDAPLGLADNSIPDSSITSSVEGSTPSAARLNGNGAWCFKKSEITLGTKVTLTIDLGRITLVSGVQSQGPPDSLVADKYYGFLGFNVLNSTSSEVEADDWNYCCEGNDLTIYSDVKEGGTDVIQTDPLETLVAARRLRLEFITDINWPGSDDKCFRLEILGCPQDVEPITGLLMEAVPAGWVVATWNPPEVIIPGKSGEPEDLVLDPTPYIAQMSRTGGGEEDEYTEVEIAARRFTIASPLWGAKYTITLLCGYQLLNLSCGTDEISAEITGCDPTELGQSSTCRIQDQVVFRRPLWLQAAVVGEGEVELTWSSDSSGWITSIVSLQVTDNDGEQIDMATLSNKEESVRVTGVEGGNNYSVSFVPQANSENLATFSFNLHILAWEGVRLSNKDIGYGAFVTDVGLDANTLWNGTLRVTWTPALVLGVSWEDPTTVEARTAPPVTPIPPVSTKPGAPDAVNATAYTPDVNITFFDNETYVNETNDDDVLDADAEAVLSLMVTASPTPVENSDATAFMYTVYLNSVGEERAENITEIDGEVISIDLSLLSFERQYSVSLTCHFGDVSVQCGSASVYTALPLHWTRLNDEIIVHANAQGLGGWSEQEEQCRLGAGTLVSLANAVEDEKLLQALTRSSIEPSVDTYWLGLNMCPDNAGQHWSDGSYWQHSRLPRVDSMLSSITCCIKAVWMPEESRYTWLGEACDALLPAICEFHPEGMVGSVDMIERGPANKTEAAISWIYEPVYWNASTMIIQYCPAKNLVHVLSPELVRVGLGNCTTATVDAGTTDYLQTELEPFTEYNVSVMASIEVINLSGPAVETIVRTHPEAPLLVTTLPSGRLNVVWAQKVSEFEETDNVLLKLTNNTHPDTTMTTRTIEAIGVTIDGISLGASYTVSLEELGNKRRKETYTVLAYPSCPCDDCQLGGMCYVISKRQSTGFAAPQQCVEAETKLITITNSTQIELLLKMAEDLRDDLWVDPDSRKISAKEEPPRDTAALLTDEVEIVDDEVATNINAGKTCLMISRSKKAVVKEACSILHTPACSRKAPVAPAFPPASAITSEIGSSYISLDWTAWDFGWKARYVIYYQRTREKRYKRALKSQEFASPPVVVSGLQLDTSYTIELVADLGGGFLSSSGEFEVSTSNETADKGKSDRLTVGSVAVGDYQIMELVCSSFLVAACITTMLLFFSTGMFYQDCVAQLAFQGTLLAAFLNLMLAHPNPVNPENESGCIIVAVVLHFLFLCSFMFLMLESLTYAHLLVIQIRSPFQRSNWLLMGFGLAVPVVIVSVCAGFTYSEYANFANSNCWLDGSRSAVWGEAVPIFILVIASIFLLINTICNKETPPELIEINLRSRQGDSHKLRWVAMALVIELAVVWSTGVSSYTTGSQMVRYVFCVFTLILAITIVCARTCLDDTFRSKMHRLCCGTELTYKRSEIMSLSGRSRVAPSPPTQPVHLPPSASSARLYDGSSYNGTPVAVVHQ